MRISFLLTMAFLVLTNTLFAFIPYKEVSFPYLIERGKSSTHHHKHPCSAFHFFNKLFGYREKGARGPRGYRGIQGIEGPQGTDGPQGTSGPQGPQGFQGVPGPQGPQGLQGRQGPQGLQGREGPPFSTANASFYINVNQDSNTTINAGANFPFTEPTGTPFFPPQGIDLNANNAFTFSKPGFYQVSYGVAVSVQNSMALIGLFYNHNPTGGTFIPGSLIFINNLLNPLNLYVSTITIPIETSQTLSLVNFGIENQPIQLQTPLPTFTQGAFITITRVADLP
jgi:hypothetical protein